MTRQVRKLAAALMVAYAVLFLQLNNVQVVRADRYRSNVANTRDIVRSFNEPRGSITTADGELVAATVSVERGELRQLRTYPHGELYAHVTGYLSLEFGAEGLERQYNDILSGEDRDVAIRSLSDLFIDRDHTGSLDLTLRHDLQLVARAALGDHRGSIVALDPTTGGVLAMWSTPTFDPNVLAGHDLDAARDERLRLLGDPDEPLLATSYRERFAPGSTFKIVTAGAALSAGIIDQDQPVYPETAEYIAPQTTRPITNFGGSTCGGAVGELLRVSCNTGFAQMGVDLGAERLVDFAESLGFGTDLGIDLPDAAESTIPEASFFDDNIPLLAQSAIGQFEVAATPLQMALVAATVANDGIAMRPHVVDRITDAQGEVLDDPDPEIISRPLLLAEAQVMQRMMQRVVDEGTARRLQTDGVLIGAKTGTAEIDGTDGTHAWIIAFAPLDDPQIALAVFVEGDDTTGQQTGGSVAAPIAKAVIEAMLQPAPSTGTPEGQQDPGSAES